MLQGLGAGAVMAWPHTGTLAALVAVLAFAHHAHARSRAGTGRNRGRGRLTADLYLPDNTQAITSTWFDLFRKAVPRDQWERQLGALRQPMGARESRAVASKAYRTALPGAPDGRYVVIQFRSSFEKKKAAVETVTPMLDADGQWRQR